MLPLRALLPRLVRLRLLIALGLVPITVIKRPPAPIARQRPAPLKRPRLDVRPGRLRVRLHLWWWWQDGGSLRLELWESVDLLLEPDVDLRDDVFGLGVFGVEGLLFSDDVVGGVGDAEVDPGQGD